MTSRATSVRVERGSPAWPQRLEHLSAPPAALWVLGTLPPPEAPCVAVVGSRRAGPGALLTARELGAGLAEAGVAVVSGMARGVDAAAHHGALSAGGITVGVLGCGIEVCYPPEHATLRDRIASSGCVLSEDGADEPPLGWRFPRRNRLIAALAEAVVVVEATARSGALSTARWAADLGREVLAVPGSIRSSSSIGTNLLIRDGVRPFLEIGDLFDAVPGLRRSMGVRRPGGRGGDEHAVGAPPAGSLPGRVLAAIGGDPIHPDDLAGAVGVDTAALAAILTTLELGGLITEVCGGRVARTF